MDKGVTIVIDDAQVVAALERLRARTADMSGVMADIASDLRKSTMDRFEDQAGPDGKRWAPFSPRTLKRMSARRRLANPQLLQDKGHLLLSLSEGTASDALSATVRTNLPYARIHQFGGTVEHPERQGEATFIFVKDGAGRKKDGTRYGSRLRFASASTRAENAHTKTFTVPAHNVTIPARPYFGISDADRKIILETIEDHYRRALGAGETP